MREHIVINSDRSVTVPDSLKKIGIQYDHNVNTLTFDCPRYADDAQSIDMSKMQIFINWMLPDKSIGCSIAENIIIDEADSTLMHFDWIITSAVTPVFGILERTLVCIKQTDTDGREIYHWNTDLFQKFSVGEGMECNEQLAEENMDVITQLLVKMDAVDTRTSTEAMRSYVGEYMTENPPQPSDEQANAGVDAYMTENGQDYVNTYMGENAQSAVNTYMDVNAQSKVNTYMEENAQEHMDTYMEQNAQNKVDDYLERNPLQLDNTLTDPTKAAPADKVGEIGTEVDELKSDLAILLEGGEVPINISESEVSGFTGSISYPKENAFVITGNNKNARLIFKIPTDIGVAYTVSLYTHTPITAYICKNEWGASGNAISSIIGMDSAGKCMLPFTAVGAYSYLVIQFVYSYSDISVYGICLSIPKKFIADAIPDNSITFSKLKTDTFNLDTMPHYFEITDAPIHFVNGLETEIYTDGLFETDVDINEIFSESNYANIFSGRFLGNRFTSNSNVGTGINNVVINSRDKHGNRWSSMLKIKTSAMPANPEKKKYILFVGDSLIARKTFPFYFQKKISELGLTNYELVGRVKGWVDSEYVRFEATGGYAWNNYVDDPATLPSSYDKNWFWNNGQLDMNYYVQTYCDGHAPDYIICNVGWNHYVNGAYSPDTMDEKCRAFIDFVHASLPNCKVILNGMHKGYPEGLKPEYRAYALNTRDVYLQIASEHDFVEYCDVASYFDGRYGMNLEQRNANIYTDAQEIYIGDYVHPNDLGMKMHAMADVCCFLWMAAQES